MRQYTNLRPTWGLLKVTKTGQVIMVESQWLYKRERPEETHTHTRFHLATVYSAPPGTVIKKATTERGPETMYPQNCSDSMVSYFITIQLIQN